MSSNNMKEEKRILERKEFLECSIEFYEKRLGILYQIYKEEFGDIEDIDKNKS